MGILESKEFLTELFKFFPDWVTKYEINGVKNSGTGEQLKDWGVNKLNSIFPLHDKSIIEMGPQEAAHTILMHNFGAKKIISLEGRLSSYIKCCVIKNVFELTNAKFYLEDLRSVELKKFGKFDVCLCSGILYHLPNPAEFIAKISEVAPRILINSHYSNSKFPPTEEVDITTNGKKYKGKKYDEVDINHINSGLQQYSFWFYKEDFIQVLKDVGYDKVEVLKDWSIEDPELKLPAITIYAEKSTT